MNTGVKLRIKIFIAGILLLATVSPLVSQAVPIGGGYNAPISSVVGNFWDMGKRFTGLLWPPAAISTTLHRFGFSYPEWTYGKSYGEAVTEMKKASLMTGGAPGVLKGVHVDEKSAEQYLTAQQDDSCGVANIGGCIRAGLSSIGQALTWAFGSLLVAAGTILDISIKVSILSVKDWLLNSGVDKAWRFLRDLGNLFFVFVLLYIAIATVFELKGVGDPKRLVVNVIIIALLVNFSGFFTRIIIDASNIVAYEFYTQMGGGAVTGGNKLGIGGQLVSRLNLTQQMMGRGSVVVKGTDSSGKEVIISTPVIRSLSITGIIVQTFGNIIIILVCCFVLIAISIMFLIRTVYLLFLYILSPLAFVSYIIPDSKYNYFNAWTQKLIHQALVAPATIIPLYVVFIFLKDGIGGLLGDDNTGLGPMGPMVLVFMNFLVIGLLFGCIVIANSLGAAGAKFATGVAGKTTLGGVKMLGKGTKLVGDKTRINSGLNWASGQVSGRASAWATGVRTAPPGGANLFARATVKAFDASKKTAFAKKATDIVKHPLMNANEAVPYLQSLAGGGGGSLAFLGATKSERHDAKKKEKEAKEEEAKEKIKKAGDDLKTATAAQAKIILGSLTDTQIKGLPNNVLERDEVSGNLTNSNLDALLKNGELETAQKTRMKANIIGLGAACPGYVYMTTGPGATMW